MEGYPRFLSKLEGQMMEQLKEEKKSQRRVKAAHRNQKGS